MSTQLSKIIIEVLIIMLIYIYLYNKNVAKTERNLYFISNIKNNRKRDSKKKISR